MSQVARIAALWDVKKKLLPYRPHSAQVRRSAAAKRALMMKSELVEIDEGIHASIVEVAVHASMVGLKLPEKSYLL